MSIIAVDPYGNKVHLPKNLLPEVLRKGGNPAIYDPPEKVIQHPAILLTSCQEPQSSLTESCENHYFRSIGWYDALLISARKVAGSWIAYQCIYNPSVKQLGQLFRTTRQLCPMVVMEIADLVP